MSTCQWAGLFRLAFWAVTGVHDQSERSSPGRGKGQFSFASSAAGSPPVALLHASPSEDSDGDEVSDEDASLSFLVVLAERAGNCRLDAAATGFLEPCAAKTGP